MSTSPVPPFLHITSSASEGTGSYSGAFHHNRPTVKGDAHTRWWPEGGAKLQTVILFIPGNPGLIDFYTPFLSDLHASCRDRGFSILAHAHLGHTPHLKSEKSMQGLVHQVEAVIEVVDTITTHWPAVQVVLAGHSVGSWIALQVLKARSDDINALFFLFPTISHIAKTPNGKRLSWAFRTPVPSLAARLSVLIRPFLYFLFPQWPGHQRSVLRSLLASPKSIFACLTMAHEEMCTITELDMSLLKQNSSKIWCCYAEKDDWVGEEQVKVIQSLGPDVTDTRVVHYRGGVAHAFCIYHSHIVANQCAEWIVSAAF